MAQLLKFAIPDEQITRMRSLLDPRQFRQATFQVVNKTTTKVAGLVRAQVRAQVQISKKYVDRVITIRPPRGDPPVGAVIIRAKRVPLIAYGTSLRVSGRLSKFVPASLLRHVFLATGKVQNPDSEGHEGIFTRARHVPTKGAGSTLLVKRGTRKGQIAEKLTPEGFAGRLAIRELTGPSILQLISVPDVIQKINFDTTAYMQAQIESQLYRFTKRR